MTEQNLEILCVTMHQTDFSKIAEMNIQCNVVFANQANRFAYEQILFDAYEAKMLTTATRGVGKNRNLALALATGDLLLFADDDMIYASDVRERVIAAFDELPQADVIVFGTHYSKNGEIYKTRLPKTGRLPFFRSLRYGTCAIAVRHKALLKNNLRFTELFGGGCLYSYGEDSDFIRQCYKKRLSVYSYHYVIGTTQKNTSTCFSGYSERFFYDKGAFAKHSLGFLALPYMLYMAARTSKLAEIPFWSRIRYLWAGYRNFDKLLSYKAWREMSGRQNHEKTPYCE